MLQFGETIVTLCVGLSENVKSCCWVSFGGSQRKELRTKENQHRMAETQDYTTSLENCAFWIFAVAEVFPASSV